MTDNFLKPIYTDKKKKKENCILSYLYLTMNSPVCPEDEGTRHSRDIE